MKFKSLILSFISKSIPQMQSTNTLITFTEAMKFASIRHQTQKRKVGQIPYINHPIEVAAILAKAGVTDYDILSAALLHDTVEDGWATYEEIEQEFGPRIKNIVKECSDDKNLPKSERKKGQIQKAAKVSEEAKLVKLADKVSNCFDISANPPEGWDTSKCYGYMVWSRAVCRNLRNDKNPPNKKLSDHIDNFFEQKYGLLKLSENEFNQKLNQYYQNHTKGKE